jgi:hypothetical protein
MTNTTTPRGTEILAVTARTGRFYAATPGDMSAVRALEARGLVIARRVMVGSSGLPTVRVTSA